MTTSPLISIIIPNYNRGNLLRETMDSILAQTYPEWEAIIVDDGSSDNSDQVGLEYERIDKRILYLKRERNPSGAPTCRNTGLEKSTGEYVIFLDSDDLLAPFCLEQRLNSIIHHPTLDFLVFPMLMFYEFPEKSTILWNIETNEPDLLRFLSLDSVWQTSGPIWKKSAVERIGGFTEGLACWQDVDIHLKALISDLKYHKFYSLAPDIYYRQHKTGSISQNEISSPAKMNSRLEVYTTQSLNLMNSIDKPVLQRLRYLGQNVTNGAIKSLNYSVTFKILSFGLKNKLFTSGFAAKSSILMLLMLLRLYKISFVKAFINKEMSKGKLETGIGKHKLLK